MSCLPFFGAFVCFAQSRMIRSTGTGSVCVAGKASAQSGEKRRVSGRTPFGRVVGRITHNPIIPMGIFCDRGGAGDRSLEICDPWNGQPVGFTFISGAERSRRVALPVSGGGRYGRSSGGTTIRTRYFPLTICRNGIARIRVNSRVGFRPGLTRDHSRVQKS